MGKKILAYGVFPLLGTAMATLTFLGFSERLLFAALLVFALSPWILKDIQPVHRLLGYVLCSCIEGLILFMLFFFFDRSTITDSLTSGQVMFLLVLFPLYFTSRMPHFLLNSEIEVHRRLEVAFRDVLAYKGHILCCLLAFLLSGLSQHLFRNNAILAVVFCCGCCYVGSVIGIHLSTCQKGVISRGRKETHSNGIGNRLSH